MKILKFNFLFVLIASIALFSGCKDDNEEEVSPFVGNFVISKATVIEAITINVNELPTPFQIPIGTDITEAIQESLLSQVNCDSADKSWVELRKDNTMYMSCEGANALNAGTWEEVSATELKLNMNSTAIPPAGFLLSVTDIASVTNGLQGNTSVPLPKDMLAAMLAGFGFTLTEDNPDYFSMKFSIVFNEK